MSDAAFSDTGRVGEVSPLDGRSLRRERNAERLYEAANTLVDDRYFDTLSGQQAYKCFACRISRV